MLCTKNQWAERYNCHTVKIGVVTAQVIWETFGYTVSVGGNKLKETFKDVETAKQQAILLARELLIRSLYEISET